MEPLQLAVCDDLPEEREALLALLERAPIPTLCTQFGSGGELLDVFRPGKFDLLLMDIYMDAIPDTPQTYCENQAVNALVSRCAGICREQGVDFAPQLTVPADTGRSPTRSCVSSSEI